VLQEYLWSVSLIIKLIHHEIGVIHTDLQTVEPDDEEVDAQEESHCTYMKTIGDAYEKAELYLHSRKDEADSLAPINIPDEGFRRRAEELETVKKRADEARAEAEEAERVLNALTLQDEKHRGNQHYSSGRMSSDLLQCCGHSGMQWLDDKANFRNRLDSGAPIVPISLHSKLNGHEEIYVDTLSSEVCNTYRNFINTFKLVKF
jgi:hypothetical protein